MASWDGSRATPTGFSDYCSAKEANRSNSELQAGAGHPAATKKCSLQPELLGAELLLKT